MSFEFTLRRTLLLLALLIAYAAFGGLDPSAMGQRVWIRLTVLYILGAVAASVIDHEVGVVDRASLRFVYVLGGAALMVGTLAWLRAVASVSA